MSPAPLPRPRARCARALGPRRFSPRTVPALTLAVTLAAALALTGACGVPSEARSGAKLMAAYTNQVKTQLETQSQSRTKLARARQRNVNALEQSALETEQRNQRERFLWRFEAGVSADGGVADSDRERLYRDVIDGVSLTLAQRDAMRELSEAHDAKLAEARSRVNTRSRELAKTAKSLAQLGETPSFKERMKFYLCFFESVQKSIKASQEAAEAKLAAGEDAASVKADDIGIPELPDETDGDDGTIGIPERPDDGTGDDDQRDPGDGDDRPSAC